MRITLDELPQLVAHFLNYERSVTIMGIRARECYLCSEKYSYCPTCSHDKTKPTWMSDFHEENCVKIFEICTRFNMQVMDKTEAQAALKECDLTNKENFRPSVQRDLTNIFAEDPKPAATKTAASAATKSAKTHEVVESKEDN